MLVDLNSFRQVFKGSCYAVALVPRYEAGDDLHICFQILVEDDGNWYESPGIGSSYWAPELIEQLKQAQEWMQKNAIPHEGGFAFDS